MRWTTLLGLFSLLLLPLLAAHAQEATPEATAACSPLPARERRELVDVLLAGDALLDIEAWRVFFVQDTAAASTVAWFKATSVVQVKHVVYACGRPAAWAEDFNTGYYQVALGSYAPYQQVAACEAEATALVEFAATSGGQPYTVRIWHEPVGEHRIREVQLLFPTADLAELDALAARFYPDFPACPAEEP